MGHVLSGEAPIVASSIKLRKDTYSLAAGRQATQEDIFDILLLIERLRTTGLYKRTRMVSAAKS